MRIVQAGGSANRESVIETVDLPVELIQRMMDASHRVNTGMPAAFALPHLIRAVLDHACGEIAEEDRGTGNRSCEGERLARPRDNAAETEG